MKTYDSYLIIFTMLFIIAISISDNCVMAQTGNNKRKHAKGAIENTKEAEENGNEVIFLSNRAKAVSPKAVINYIMTSIEYLYNSKCI